MSWYNKVAWSEGLFLRPQLFQQQERYLEHLAHKRAAALNSFYWGFSHFAIDAESLSLGKVVLASAAGIFADGTPFDAPGQTLPPAPLTILPEHLDQVIHLAVPIRTPNGEETSFDEPGASSASLARFSVFDTELRDSNSIGQGPKTVQLSRLRLRLLPEREMTFKGDDMFVPGRARLNARIVPVLVKVADEINQVAGSVQVTGHSDNLPIRTREFPDNQALSEKRAAAVAQVLQDQGVSASRLKVEGRGDTAPVADNTTAMGRARNRRVDIVVTQDAR